MYGVRDATIMNLITTFCIQIYPKTLFWHVCDPFASKKGMEYSIKCRVLCSLLYVFSMNIIILDMIYVVGVFVSDGELFFFYSCIGCADS